MALSSSLSGGGLREVPAGLRAPGGGGAMTGLRIEGMSVPEPLAGAGAFALVARWASGAL